MNSLFKSDMNGPELQRRVKRYNTLLELQKSILRKSNISDDHSFTQAIAGEAEAVQAMIRILEEVTGEGGEEVEEGEEY